MKNMRFHTATFHVNHINLTPPPTRTRFRVCFAQPGSTNTEIKKRLCTPSKTCVFTHHAPFIHIDLMSPPTSTHFQVCFVQPKSTNAEIKERMRTPWKTCVFTHHPLSKPNTEIKKRMCTPSKTCVFTHHPLSKPYRFNAAPYLYALPSRLYTSRVDLNHLPSTFWHVHFFFNTFCVRIWGSCKWQLLFPSEKTICFKWHLCFQKATPLWIGSVPSNLSAICFFKTYF